MTSTIHGARADLEARAGASDQDRARWLAERRTGVTATEVRDLALGKLRAQDLIDLKLGRKVDDFTGNAYTKWGKEREVIIAADLRGVGIEPETRVFHHAENSRHLASPDGVGVGFDDELLVSEIKTCGHALPIGSVELDEKGYLLQVQWVMHVTGAVRCLLVVEERISVAGGFVPGPRAADWVDRDEQVIAGLVELADGFLAELDAQRENGAPVIDEVVDTHAVNYLRGLAAEKEGRALKESAYAALIAAGVSQESPLARVTFTPGTPGGEFDDVVIDLDAAAAAHPKETAALERAKARVVKLQAEWDALASEHKKTVKAVASGSKPRVTVTAGKGMKK
ncbi:YqaJ viral recombinase family protein [Microbacterium sp. PM5]|uniref:YqaJ viral recombinase family protein n=1 Tax=Microbacterium sp. PM5 TaxID=2014534 RepID=UPI000DD104D9|nr:YqaJ viral recombinase family protein [Microbacterium sp. PM5]AXA95423.1 hypothetical protein CEP17_02760 [Microbacterium sp. PM5]